MGWQRQIGSYGRRQLFSRLGRRRLGSSYGGHLLALAFSPTPIPLLTVMQVLAETSTLKPWSIAMQ